MSDDVVIKVENLYKEYRLGTISHGTLYKDLQSWWARMRGKEDPNSIISTVHLVTGTTNYERGTKNHELINPHFLALQDVSFEVKRGEVLGIIGRNGAGKSTLLKILSEVTSPTKGTVRIKGRVASLLEVGTGFHPELTGRENVYLNGAILGMTKKEIQSKFDEIVAFAELDQFIDTPVKRYSSGMYVRLAFAVAAHLDPDIMIIDEVLAVGDAAFQRKCLGKMGEVSKEGRTVLFVSHNMSAIKQLCSTCLWIDRGQIADIGATEKIISTYLGSVIPIDFDARVLFDRDHNKDFQMLRARLINEAGQECNQFNCDESIVVEITSLSHRPIPGLYGYFSVMTTDGVKVLVSDSRDLGVNAYDSLPVGEHTHHIVIPPRLLGAGEYCISISFASDSNMSGFLVHTPGKPLFKFSLSDHTTARGNNRGGFVSALLRWEDMAEAGIKNYNTLKRGPNDVS